MPQTATPDATDGLNRTKNRQTIAEFFNGIGPKAALPWVAALALSDDGATDALNAVLGSCEIRSRRTHGNHGLIYS